MNLKQITNALVYDRQTQLRGLVDKLTIDGRKTTKVEHKALGMVGMLELPGRPLQALSGKIEIGHFDAGYDRILINPTTMHDWQLHQKVDVFGADGYDEAASHTVVHHLKWMFMEDDGLDTELGEKAGVEYTITIPFLKQTVLGDEVPIFELDVWNDVYKVNGKSVWNA